MGKTQNVRTKVVLPEVIRFLSSALFCYTCCRCQRIIYYVHGYSLRKGISEQGYEAETAFFTTVKEHDLRVRIN